MLRELTTDTAERPGGLAVLFVPAVLLGNARLLLGMVRANRPWRFTARLYGALVAALATGVLSLVFADHWRIATAIPDKQRAAEHHQQRARQHAIHQRAADARQVDHEDQQHRQHKAAGGGHMAARHIFITCHHMMQVNQIAAGHRHQAAQQGNLFRLSAPPEQDAPDHTHDGQNHRAKK